MSILVDGTAILIGVVVSLCIVVPNVICIWIWSIVASRRVLKATRDCEEWRVAATNAVIKAHITKNSEDDTDEDFPSR